MRDVEQLKKFRDLLRSECMDPPWVDKLFDRIIERLGPYEPGEVIEVTVCPGSGYRKLPFLCPQDKGVWVWDNMYGQECATWWPHHRPIPKTRKLDVPVELIEQANNIVKCNKSVGFESPKCVEWLAKQAEGGYE